MFNERIKSPILFLLALTAGMFATPAIAQDDLYYDPATDAPKPVQVVVVQEAPVNNNLTRVYNEEGYSDDDYAYEYSSRIRRFHQPTEAVDYYDPLYTDMYYYDPYYAPGTSIYVNEYNDYWAWRSWQRWQYVNPYAYAPMYGWNSFGYSPWGWNVGFGVGFGFGWGGGYGYGYPAWGCPAVYNSFYYDPYWAWNGYNPYYCPAYTWNNGYYGGGYYGDNGHYPETYYGPRRGNTTVDPGFQSSKKYKDGRLSPAPNPTGDPERVKAATANGRKIESDREPATNVERQMSTSKAPGRPTEKPTTVTPTRRPQTEADVQAAAPTRRPQTAVRPSAPVRRPEREVEKALSNPDHRPEADSKQPSNAAPSRRPETQEARPGRRTESAPAQQQNTRERPTRPSRDESSTRERSNDDIPANARPSRGESRSEMRSNDRPSSPSTRINDGGSSGRSSGGNNSGGSSGRSSSGGGNTRSGGRN